MKLKSILFVFATILFSSAYSQQFNAGLLAGVNASQVSGDGYSGFNKAGILVGMYSNVSISQKLDFQLEINYSEKGSRRNPKTSKGDVEYFLLRTNYIEIPVMILYKKGKFTYEFGAYYGRLITDHFENQDGASDIPEFTTQLKNHDVGLLVGINYNFTRNLIMNWRFSSSVTAFRKYDSGASFRLDNGLQHRYLSFAFKYQFYGNKQK